METNVEVLQKYRDLFPLCESKNGQGKEKSESGQLLDDAPSDSFASGWALGERCHARGNELMC
jgi:hypothetical protein